MPRLPGQWVGDDSRWGDISHDQVTIGPRRAITTEQIESAARTVDNSGCVIDIVNKRVCAEVNIVGCTVKTVDVIDAKCDGMNNNVVNIGNIGNLAKNELIKEETVD